MGFVLVWFTEDEVIPVGSKFIKAERYRPHLGAAMRDIYLYEVPLPVVASHVVKPK